MKIEKLIESIRRPTTHYADQDFEEGDIIEIMKTYAEYYAIECLKLAGQKINVTEEITHPMQLKLPEHE